MARHERFWEMGGRGKVEVTNTQTHAALSTHFTWESVRASRVTRRDTRQERAHSVEQHWNTFSSGQSLVQMNTVADGLASLSFHQGKRKKRREKKDGEWKQRRGQGEKTVFTDKTEAKCDNILLQESRVKVQRSLSFTQTQFLKIHFIEDDTKWSEANEKQLNWITQSRFVISLVFSSTHFSLDKKPTSVKLLSFLFNYCSCLLNQCRTILATLRAQ